MNIHPIFCSFIAVEPYIKVNNDFLEDYCKKKIYSSSNYSKGNLQSDLLNLEDAEIQPLLLKVNTLINDVAKTVGLKENLQIVRAWANLNHNEAIVQPHAHTKSVLSCVYYVKGDRTSGDITFMTPINALDYVMGKEHILEHTDFNLSLIHI